MEYAQLNETLTEALQITTHGNVEWDSTHFCPASKLTEDEATQFRVVPLTVTEQPAFDNATQSVVRDGCEKVGDVWQYKWRIDALTAEQIAAKRIAAIPASVSPRQIRQALTRAGLRASVETAVAAEDQDTKDWYEFATQFERTSPIVAALGLALSVTPLQLDDLWTLAGSL